MLVVCLFVVQVAGPLHHDPQGHRTSRAHCTACPIALAASSFANDVAPRLRSLPPAERLVVESAPACTTVPRVFASDSSPPSTPVEL